MHALPAATRGLLIANVLVFALLALGGGGLERYAALAGGLIPARLTGELMTPGLPPALTLVTSMFLHAGLMHLALNMLTLLVVGRFVEAALGAERFLGFYLIGGIAGGLLQVLMGPSSGGVVIGASGAISAVFAAHALWFGRHGREGGRALGRQWSPHSWAALRLGAAWLGFQLLLAAAIPNLAVWAHVGGFGAGLLMANAVARRADARR